MAEVLLRDASVPAAALDDPCPATGRSGEVRRVDVELSGGRIAAVAPRIEPRAGLRVVELGGALLLPGLIDNHVHYREPGATWKEGYVTGTSASLRGGATTVGEIQNNAPLVEDAAQWRAKVASLAGRARTRVLVYGCATPANSTPEGVARLRELAAVAPGVKVFLAADGALEVSGRAALRRIFEAVAAVDGLLVVHAEFGPMVHAESARFGSEPSGWSRARSPAAERAAIDLCNELCAETGARVHYFHVSSALACESIRAAKSRGLPVSGAACAHYLLFTDEEVARRGALLKCNPSIKGALDRRALRAALRDGTLDVIQSDHAPHPRAEKLERPFGQAPSGLPGADLFLSLWLALVDDGVLTLDQLVERGARGPARLHRLSDRGVIAPGRVADLVEVEAVDWTVVEADFASKASHSPYVGMRLRRRAARVWIDGEVVFDRAVPEDLAAREAAAPPPLEARGSDGKSGCC